MKSTIVVEDAKKQIYAMFEAEVSDSINARASYAIDHKDGETHFLIQAKDPTSLRATLNSICRLLVVYHSMRDIQ